MTTFSLRITDLYSDSTRTIIGTDTKLSAVLRTRFSAVACEVEKTASLRELVDHLNRRIQALSIDMELAQ